MMKVIDISPKPCCIMQEAFGTYRKRAATCRRLSGAPENVLHPRKRLSGERKMCGIYLNFG
ncbi:hypothetical protein [Chryseobacterium sp. POE27]|uniref:hypothetical protein n=1 Tax=Chryseobacterium sp. POE27 TaxID=3138177 RepID=UPI00321A1A39